MSDPEEKSYTWLFVLISIIALAFLVFLIDLFGGLSSINPAISLAVAGTPNTACTQNSDCAFKATHCDPCDCGSPVNKNWEQFCPLRVRERTQCKPCPTDNRIACISSRCTTK